ncbi:MAG: two-component system, OmpR family, sensor histidine kinase SenX3 [Actinomycetota bacterium]|nr:two-component system, OmpR family, sensor histidine kinase SenX3 [Actinomycetota bacterium]
MSPSVWPPPKKVTGRLARAEREHARSIEIIARMDEGVLVLNSSLTPVSANNSARRLLGIASGGLPPQISADNLISVARRCLADAGPVDAILNLDGRDVRARAIPLEDGIGMFLHDVTEELGTQRLRRQFAANASHELKTPVASLQALVEGIEKALDGDLDAARRFTARLGVEVHRLRALIDDLMDLSRVEDPAAMSAQKVDLSGLVTTQIEEMTPIAADSNLTIDHEVADGIQVLGDSQHLELLLRNLLDNAVRYSTHGGRLRVTLAHSDDAVLLEVADEGIGIPLHAQSRIFERFFRVDEDRARGSGGTGLGLSIVKNVAESHGGTVAVTSELDEGSTFAVVLPVLEEGGG